MILVLRLLSSDSVNKYIYYNKSLIVNLLEILFSLEDERILLVY